VKRCTVQDHPFLPASSRRTSLVRHKSLQPSFCRLTFLFEQGRRRKCTVHISCSIICRWSETLVHSRAVCHSQLLQRHYTVSLHATRARRRRTHTDSQSSGARLGNPSSRHGGPDAGTVDSSPLRPLRALQTPEACIHSQRRSPASQANEGNEKKEDRLTATKKFLTQRGSHIGKETQKKSLNFTIQTGDLVANKIFL
jgi:hypothetical protein